MDFSSLAETLNQTLSEAATYTFWLKPPTGYGVSCAASASAKFVRRRTHLPPTCPMTLCLMPPPFPSSPPLSPDVLYSPPLCRFPRNSSHLLYRFPFNLCVCICYCVCWFFTVFCFNTILFHQATIGLAAPAAPLAPPAAAACCHRAAHGLRSHPSQHLDLHPSRQLARRQRRPQQTLQQPRPSITGSTHFHLWPQQLPATSTTSQQFLPHLSHLNCRPLSRSSPSP